MQNKYKDSIEKELSHSAFRHTAICIDNSTPHDEAVIAPSTQGNLTQMNARYVRICEYFTNNAIILQSK